MLFRSALIVGILLYIITNFILNNRSSPEAMDTVKRGWRDAWSTKPGPVEFVEG